MTIKASYNTFGEKVFSFPCNLYKNGSFIQTVNNTDYEKMGSGLPPFDANAIAIYKGNDNGYFLTALHEDKPVRVIETFVNFQDLKCYLERMLKKCSEFNCLLSDNNVFFSYYLLNHVINYTNPASPCFHFLIKKVNDFEGFLSLYACYESLYKKRKEFDQVASKKSSKKFFEILTDEELSLLKFTLFANTNDYILCDYLSETFLHNLCELEKNAFEFCSISDFEIDGLFQMIKMKKIYFSYKIRNKIGTPSIYYYNSGIESYLKPEDELDLWRSGKEYQNYMNDNFNYVLEMNEPDDRG